jgi:hypothetical protein
MGRMCISETEQPTREWMIQYTNTEGQAVEQVFMEIPENWGLAFK